MGVFVQWFYKNGLALPVVVIDTGLAPVTTGFTKWNPSGGLVAGTGKTAVIHKSFRYQNRVAMYGQPIRDLFTIFVTSWYLIPGN